MPVGRPIVNGYLFSTVPGVVFPVLPGGMLQDLGIFIMTVAGPVAFAGNPPL